MTKTPRRTLALAVGLLVVTTASAQQEALDEGIELFRASDFAGAMVRFREALLVPSSELPERLRPENVQSRSQPVACYLGDIPARR